MTQSQRKQNHRDRPLRGPTTLEHLRQDARGKLWAEGGVSAAVSVSESSGAESTDTKSPESSDARGPDEGKGEGAEGVASSAPGWVGGLAPSPTTSAHRLVGFTLLAKEEGHLLKLCPSSPQIVQRTAFGQSDAVCPTTRHL